MDSELHATTLKKSFYYDTANEIDTKANTSLSHVDIEYNLVKNMLEAKLMMDHSIDTDNSNMIDHFLEEMGVDTNELE